MAKKVKAIWKFEDIKVVFSEPRIQPWESVVYVESQKDFLYYYYTMTVYRKIKKKWKKELSADVWDFPDILILEKVFRLLQGEDVEDGTWQVIKNTEHDVTWYIKGYGTDDIVNDDFYRIERTIRIADGERKETYSLTVGSGMNNGMDMHNDALRCVRIDYLRKEEITGFVETAKKFIKKSIKEYNEKEQQRITAEKMARRVKNGKLYDYHVDCKNGFRKTEMLEEVFVVGDDEVEIGTLEKYKAKDVFVEYHSCRLVAVEESRIGMGGYIIIEGEYKTFGHTTESLKDRQVKIPVELIMNIFNYHDKDSEVLRYNIEQCKEDFLKILSKEERKEFAETPLPLLLEKWSSAVAGRTWMYRDEHEFKNPEKTIKKVVKEIRKECRKEV